MSSFFSLKYSIRTEYHLSPLASRLARSLNTHTRHTKRLRLSLTAHTLTRSRSCCTRFTFQFTTWCLPMRRAGAQMKTGTSSLFSSISCGSGEGTSGGSTKGTTGGPTDGEVLFEPTDLPRLRNLSRGDSGEPRGCAATASCVPLGPAPTASMITLVGRLPSSCPSCPCRPG